uniref:RING-type E3 ubiquitin transferase n=1 Tax=Setaria italica TaxID=4555 RepID=K3XSY2_SETIT
MAPPPSNPRHCARQHQRLQAEGVYDTKTGYLSMVGCRELNGSTDCQVLITVQFTSFDADRMGFGDGKGRISSLRDSTDELYFEARGIDLFGMYSGQVSESIRRMDLESIVTVASTTLSSVFTALQILHTKRNREAGPATSVTMLVVTALGYATPLVVNLDALLANRRKQFVQLSSSGMLELNELMLTAPAVIAFVLQLRLLQLAWPAGRTNMAAERNALLQVCLPLRAARESLVVRLGPEPGTLWQGLASYAGLVLDGFLLPQVVLNALSGSSRGTKAISPWFYAGGTAIRVATHLYDAARARSYAPSVKLSYVYAGPSDGLFGVAWDVVVPFGAASLALLLFLQQRFRGDFSLSSRSRSGGYQMGRWSPICTISF